MNPIKVLDKGYVLLIDKMGDDSSIADAARVSYNKGTKKINNDSNLIRYLIRHKHETPLEMVQFKFQIKLPLFVFNQWVRHRMSSFNVTSFRYSEVPDEFYIPSKERVTTQSNLNKQCSSTDESEYSDSFIEYTTTNSKTTLNQYLSFVHNNETNPNGVSREVARINIPQNIYTEFVWSINLRSLFNFLNLRMSSHAQYEIREYANVIFEIIKPIVPIATKAFEEYSLNSLLISSIEKEILNECIDFDKMKNLIDLKVKEGSISNREGASLLHVLNYGK